LENVIVTDTRKMIPASSNAADVRRSVKQYEEIIPARLWPVVLCAAGRNSSVQDAKKRLEDCGLKPVDDPGMEDLGLVSAACPPEPALLSKITDDPGIEACAVPETPVVIKKEKV